MIGIDSYYKNLQSVCTVFRNNVKIFLNQQKSSKSTLDIKNFAPKSEGYSDQIQIFFQRYGRFSKNFVNLKKSRHYFRKLYIQIVDFCNSFRFQPFPINKFERLDSYEILKFCGEMNWTCLASELRLNAKTIEFLSSFYRNVVRDDQFQLLDLRHLHFFNSTHPNKYLFCLC
jgi:hypothetical protein